LVGFEHAAARADGFLFGGVGGCGGEEGSAFGDYCAVADLEVVQLGEVLVGLVLVPELAVVLNLRFVGCWDAL